MSNHLQKITTRAKQLKKLHPNTSWINLVKKASAEYRSGSLGAKNPKKKKAYQTGSSNKVADRKIKAKSPGKRKSATGRKYFERRANRSDMPGTLTGVSSATLTSTLKTRLKDELGKQLVKRETATTKRDRRAAQKLVAETKYKLKKLS